MVQRTVREGFDAPEARPDTLAVESHSSCPLARDNSLQRRRSESLRASACYDKVEKQEARR